MICFSCKKVINPNFTKSMQKGKYGVIIAIILLIIIVALVNQSSQKSESIGVSFTVGAVLPMTGPAALWGETVKNGMELALEEKSGIEAVYEDSKSTAADGISAYNLLQDKNVDLTFSELSLVSVPLAKNSLRKKTSAHCITRGNSRF